jgi:hypothetical protein
MEQLTPLIVIVVAVLALGFLWKLITGVIRLVVTLAVIGVVVYFLFQYLG